MYRSFARLTADPAEAEDLTQEVFVRALRALQVVHADDRGHWPWDLGYRGVRGGQPVLGIRTFPPVSVP